MTSHARTASPATASHRWRPITATLVAGLAAAALAGCGADEAERATQSRASTLSVTETDFAIDPADATVDEAGTVRITVVNRGQAPHALAIETRDGAVQTDTLNAGDSGEVEADLEEGTYTWYCPIGDHRAKGMEGKLTVGDATAPEDSGSAESESRGNYGY
jgi:plastocyanin